MSFTSRLSAVALLATMAFPLAAQATSGSWDSTVLGQSGTGTSAANAWISSPASGSVYAEWNVINGYPADTTPDIAGSGTLSETTGAAFLTSGGNIYSFSAPTAFTVALDGDTGGTWDVYLRVAGLGTSLADLATLNGQSASRVVTYTSSLGGAFGGSEEESLWHWTLSGSSDWLFGFNAVGSSLSLDQVAVYAVQQAAAPVPEPSTSALLIAGLAALGGLMRRRAKQA